jgi:hypothetical protein
MVDGDPVEIFDGRDMLKNGAISQVKRATERKRRIDA